jgi:hypothetical protein
MNQTDGPQFQYTRLLGEHEHLDEEVFQLGQEGASTRGQHLVLGVQGAHDETERHDPEVARSIVRERNTPVAEPESGIPNHTSGAEGSPPRGPSCASSAERSSWATLSPTKRAR